jgi:hypothetical protein
MMLHSPFCDACGIGHSSDRETPVGCEKFDAGSDKSRAHQVGLLDSVNTCGHAPF